VFSFNSAQSIGLPWRGFTLHWYPSIIHTAGFGDALRSSLIIAAVGVTGSVIVGVPAAMALRGRSPWLRRGIRSAVMLPFIIPGVMIGVAVITTASARNFALGVGPTIFVHLLLSAPLIVLVVYARLSGMDLRVIEAARDLGSTSGRAFRTVTLPIALPSIIGAALLAFAYSMDEIIVTSFTIGSSNTLPVWLLSQARTGFNPGINALGVMMSVGTFVLFAGLVVVLLRTTSARAGRGHE
jgi:spermidine/putrescine transport system permease protein